MAEAVLDNWLDTFAALRQSVADNGALDAKTMELIELAINATATHLHAAGVRRHIRNALRLGATRAEILEVLKLCGVIGIHSSALGVPILAEELAQAETQTGATSVATPTCAALRATRQFNPLWETLYEWEPLWLEQFLTMGVSVWQNGILPPQTIELLCIAGDAAVTHLYAPGVRRHIRTALQLGVSRAEILAVLKLVSLQGIQSCELAIPILDEESRQ